ncbi:putative small integral membrane protein [Roseibium hamelinense]|uniref:Putative small integral membrane protein n=1 Tax=Roseibium hamelinense TaxID=150831 RepID=A0A562TIU9_9HYPH|nr:DUF2165 domain-containing protein [Roseibium hamelinense]TWI93138.1 putative small integral membrane protein [Roseibium hamelinense]
MARKILCLQISKVCLVASAGLFAFLAGLSNIQDPHANMPFVRHVLSMDTVFADNPLSWRAITNTAVHTFAFGAIVFVEFAVAALCFLGALNLARAAGKSPAAFHDSKGLACLGLTLGILLWFTGFMTIGGEWFLMWQSTQWSGIDAAFRFSALLLLMLVFVQQPEA